MMIQNINLEKFCKIFFVILIALLYVCRIVYYNSMQENVNVDDEKPFSKALKKVCSLTSEVELSSVVWSHKGSIKELDITINDASKTAINSLIDAGIYRFDIDVCKVDYHGNSGIYVVHPKVIELEGSSFNLFNYLSIEEFLQVVLDKSNAKDCFNRIFITIEPKFEDKILLSKLIDIVSKSKLYNNVAIITSNYNTLSFVDDRLQSYETKAILSLAFRNQPNNDVKLLQWHNKSITKSINTDISRVMYMPDIHLLTMNDVTIIEKILERKHSKDYKSLQSPLVVAWVIDSVDGMWDALGAGVDGVISNYPLKLLEALRIYYRSNCMEVIGI
jgi:hypothetical protein